MTDQPTIFISYSHKDEKPWKELIVGHLKVAERQGEFLVWDDRRMDAGDHWRDEINAALEAADIGILLISRHFLTSNFIMDHEMKVLLERKQREGLRLYPILLSSCNWKSVDWLERMNLKPLDAQPLDGFDDAQRESQAAGMATEIGHHLKEDRESTDGIEQLRTEAEELGKKLGVTEDAVQSFLDILDQRHVDSAHLKEKLEEIASQYQEMQERLVLLDQDDPVIRGWIDQAKAAIDEGEYDEADKLLTQAEERDLSAARQAAAQADQRFLNAAATRAIRGEASLTQLRYLKAAEHFSEAAKIVPASQGSIKAGYLTQQGEALTKGSRTQAALEAYEQATALDSDEFSPWINLGRLHQQAGNLSAAEDAFLKAKANAKDERSRSVSLNDLGNVRVDQGDLAGALTAYQASLAIAERLAEEDPGHAGWQRDLSVSHDRIGDVRVAQGDLAGALTAFQASLAIRERLAEEDPGHAGWQRDLIVSRAKLAGLAEQGYVSESALDHWRAALEIALELQQSGRLAPVDTWMVDDIQKRIDALIEPAAGSGG